MSSYAPMVAAQSSLAASEIVKRSENAQGAYASLKSGDDAYRAADYATAVQKYAEAISNLPMNALATRGLRVSAVQRFSQASLVRAQELQRSGQYDEIQVLLDEVDRVDPDNFGVSQFRKKMDDPIRTNPSLTAEHTRNVDKVRRLLYEAQGYYDLGLYDRAEMTYEDVLRIDKFNKAARRGMERVSHAISQYGTSARDQARSEVLQDVDAAWEDRSRLNLEVPLLNEQTEGGQGPQNETLVGKLNTIMVPSVDLQDASLDESLDFLRIASRANDTASVEQSAKGLDFILQLGSPDNPKVQAVNQARINVNLRNVSLQQALKVITEATGTQYRIDEFAVVIYPTGAADPTLIRRDFRVPANFLSSSALNGTGGGGDDPFATPEAGSGSLIAKRLNATEKLKSLGLPFPEGATASFNGGVLSVRNTAENLEYVAEIVNTVASQEPIGVVIKTTVIDISQTDFEELGFDSIINELNVGSNYKLSGGTTGSGTAITDTIGGNPASSGLRIGELTGGTDSLDAIINRTAPPTASGAFASSGGAASSSITAPTGGGGGTTRSPGVLSFRALIDENAHELLIRGFDQKKGADVMVRPEVITRSGQNAEIASIQEFTYPTEFEPPEIPNSVGAGESVVTPATPTSFEVKNLGVMLEVLPEVSADRQFIEVAVKPTIREFEGFVNYGTPIVGSSTSTSFDIAGGILSQSGNVGVLTTNDILVPVFKEVTTNTNVVVQNGHTIVIGGLLTESRKKVEDRVPILGDIPWFGRFFQTNALESESRHVIIMVNVELVDAAGKPYRNR
ncbi:type II and III secretion system protein [bacterium]|nr:type II and III secretion system protein [bacterium]